MKNLSEATKLAETMKKIGELANKETVCIITSMEEPLGEAVGNSLEVIEAVQALKGNIKEDVKEVVLSLGAYMLKLAGKGNDIEVNKQKMLEQIQNGKALEKFKQLVQIQGGDVSYIENTKLFKKAKYVVPVIAKQEGYVQTLDAKTVGEISMNLGAGRLKKEDDIDLAVGIVLKKKIADEVKMADTLAYIYANNEEKAYLAMEQLQNCYKITNKRVEKKKNILKIL